jgi:hypothetical protein
VRILGIDGSPLRHLTLDTTKDYQPQPATAVSDSPWLSTMS